MKKGTLLTSVPVVDTGQKGKAVARHQGHVIWLEQVAPGDVVDLTITGRQKKQLQGRVERIVSPSPDRVTPFCDHFGHCGGCKWQHIAYEAQLRQKAKWVRDCFERIGGLSFPDPRSIVAAPKTRAYRNKLDFAASSRRWLTADEIGRNQRYDSRALGFHVSGHFDKVLDIETCHLMPDYVNTIRNGIRDFARDNDMPFYDPKAHEGFLRGVVIRADQQHRWMVMLVIAYDAPEWLQLLSDYIQTHLTRVVSLYHVINAKSNDALYDCEHRLIYGAAALTETVNEITLSYGPRSFAQTNTGQSERLYREALELAEVRPEDRVYDLYCGVGAITLQLARRAGSVLGIETAPEAVAWARENARMNAIDNVAFHCGAVEKMLGPEFYDAQGHPHLLVIDPPRSGVHPKVMRAIGRSGADRFLYISCNPATQARDLALLEGTYHIQAMQPVDMFPHTPHVENIALLKRAR